jgi:hypothetical protein
MNRVALAANEWQYLTGRLDAEPHHPGFQEQSPDFIRLGWISRECPERVLYL